MTKKHFIALADAIKASNSEYPFAGMEFCQHHLAVIADFLEEQNPRFNRQHWFDYIDGKVKATPKRTK